MFSKLNLNISCWYFFSTQSPPFLHHFSYFQLVLKFQQIYGARIQCKHKFLINKFRVVKYVDIKFSNNIKEGKIKAPSHNTLQIIYFFIHIVRKLTHNVPPK